MLTQKIMRHESINPLDAYYWASVSRNGTVLWASQPVFTESAARQLARKYITELLNSETAEYTPLATAK